MFAFQGGSGDMCITVIQADQALNDCIAADRASDTLIVGTVAPQRVDISEQQMQQDEWLRALLFLPLRHGCAVNTRRGLPGSTLSGQVLEKAALYELLREAREAHAAIDQLRGSFVESRLPEVPVRRHHHARDRHDAEAEPRPARAANQRATAVGGAAVRPAVGCPPVQTLPTRCVLHVQPAEPVRVLRCNSQP